MELFDLEETKSQKRIYQSMKNNAQGKLFEQGIEMACATYQQKGVAIILKTPEPFRVTKKYKNGRFEGRFTSKKAQPDFQGVYRCGRSIIFEAKFTTTDAIKKSVLTKTQEEMLEEFYQMGAKAGVCVGIKERSFFIPWGVWRDFKKEFGKSSATANDLKEWEVFWKNGIMFLG